MKKNTLQFIYIISALIQFSIFSVLLAQPGGQADSPISIKGYHSLHVSSASNISFNTTVIDNPYSNGNPNALVFVEQNWNPGNSGGTYNNSNVGVWYTGSQWSIYNQNLADMPEFASFNVLIAPSGDPNAFVHTSTPSNTTTYITNLSHPGLDGNPDAKLIVTPSWNPSGVGGVYNDHAVGVWYDGSVWTIFNEDFTPIPENASFNVLVLGNSAEGFVHTADASNITLNWTVIDNPALNGNPNALIFTSQYWNPSGIYNAKPTGVWYDGFYWSVYIQDLSDFPEGASFFVYTGSPYFVHTTSAENTINDFSQIDNPLFNLDGEAVLFATHNWNPGGIGGTYHDYSIGLFDNGSNWGVFNQDASTMPEGVSFNMAAAPHGETAFRHTTTATNIVLNWTTIDNPLLNDNPSARIIVTPVFVLTRHLPTIGVWYDGSKWAIFNQDISTMAENADFNVMVLDESNSITHVADASNTFGNYTIIDDPRLNGNPDANIIVTQNWSIAGVYNDHEVGVWYTGTNWSVYNEDMSDMPENAAFNIYIAWAEAPITSVESEENIPLSFSLEQNYPNPFNPSTTIKYEITEPQNVILKVYDILGGEVATLVNEAKSPGRYEVSFNGSNLSSGIYFYRIYAGEFTAVKKMMLIK